MSQEHERALGNWQAELAQWPAVFIQTFSAIQALAELLGGLEIHLGRCQDNIDAMQGVIFAEGLSEVLTPALGKVEAQSLMTNLCQRAISERRSLGILVLELIETDLRCKSIDRLDVEKRFDVELAKVASARLLEEILDQTENDVSVETGF